jgi:polyisoprenoid-binding protein YceI
LGQKYQTEKSSITFFSSALIEDISAKNNASVSLFDLASGEIAVTIPINKFKFEKELMEEHFNEKYLESEKFPNATFSGKITDVVIKGSDTQANATGKLTLHGVTRNVTIRGHIHWIGDYIVMKSGFTIKLEDYKIKIPKLMWQNIAEEVAVEVELNFSPL